MSTPTIERTDLPHEAWVPHLATEGFAGPVYKLAAKPFMPYDEAKLASNVVTTQSIFVAAKLVEQGFCIRMLNPATRDQNMCKPEILRITW